MSDDLDSRTDSERKRIPLWPWFAAGFLLTFFGLALFKTVYLMAPSGQAVIAVKLWRFYVLELPEFFQFRARALGPETVNQEALVTLMVSHFGASVFVGTIVLAVVCCLSYLGNKVRRAL